MIEEFFDRQAADADLYELEDAETGEKKQVRIVSKAAVTQEGTPLNKATFDPILADIRSRLSASAVADFVVEQGTSGHWQYRKWKGGTAECWGIGTLTDITSISGRGTYFYSTPVSIAYPDGLFTGRVVPHVALNPSIAFAVPSYTDFGAVAANFYILTPNEARTSFTVNYAIYAAGSWK